MILKLTGLVIALSLVPDIAMPDTINSLLEERLGHMKDVAAYKWQHGLPIEDQQREQVVIKHASVQGLKYRLRIESSEKFFQLQIDAAKEVQRYWFEHWKIEPELIPTSIPDLAGEVRPVLIKLGNQITRAIANNRSPAPGTISVEGLSMESANRLLQAVNSIERYSNQLEQVLASKILRVGTTGDYAPFSSINSHEDNSEPYQGIDIDLARDLANSLQVELVWIETSWPTLMEDLRTGAFDIGMSGISINLLRQRFAFFSLPYHQGGKTPIIRCSDSSKFKSLADIDKADVHIVVNPGGTNQKFVEQSIKNAQVRVHEDNRSIFAEIVNLKADVMITDAIEVQLQSSRDERLCPAMPGETFTYQQKGYLMPQDPVWKEFVNAWLSLRITEGLVEETFTTHLAH